MFNLFCNNKEYLSCEWLEYGIHFDVKGLYHCPQFFHNNANNIPVSLTLKEHKYNYKDFFNKKKKIRKEQRKGIINERCKGCLLLKKQKWDKIFKVTNMAISSFSKCNSDCIYCPTHQNKEYFNSIPDVPILDFLKDLDKKHLIDKDIHIEWGGGEPTIADEFEQIIEFLQNKTSKRIKIHSSGIKYSKAIEHLLNNDKCELIISPDSGTSETYKKIKNTDKFDDVWTNIKQYVKAQNHDKKQVFVKYLIIPGINDNRDEILNFFNKAIESGVINIRTDIESAFYKENHNNIEKIKEIFKLFKFIKDYSKEHNLLFAFNAQADVAVNEHSSLYKDITE